MNRRVIDVAVLSLLTAAFPACSSSGATTPYAVAPQAMRNDAKAAQYLYVYDAGSPGVYTGEYARYSIPDLSVQETTAASGLGSAQAFGKSGLPYFFDEATGHSGFAVYSQPVKKGVVPATQEFYGVPCQSPSLSIGPTGNFYAVQYCSTNVLEYKSGPSKKAKKPIATYTGGNLGKSGIIGPTYAAVDLKGNLYVGDNGGGVTYFAAGSTKGIIAFPTNGGYVNQMVVDRNGDVWSVHGPNPTAVYFPDKKTCKPVKSGPVVRNEYGERFSKGKLVAHLYTETSDSPLFSDNGVSIAIDSKGRVYTGNQNNGISGVVLDFDPKASCPNDGLSFALDMGALPQVAVDTTGTFYVTDYRDNTISAYKSASTKLLKKITQKKSLVAITYAAVSP